MLKRLLLLSFVCLLLLLPAGICGAEPTYTITETELTLLQNNLTQLEMLNSQQLAALKESQEDCMTLKQQLIDSQNQIQTLKRQLTTLQTQSAQAMEQLKIAQSSLDNASKLYKQYVKEEQQEKNKLKIERDFFILATVVMAVHK